MESDIIVIDNFCEELDAVIEVAKEGGFGTWTPSNVEYGISKYTGMGFMGSMAPLFKELMLSVGVVVPNQTFFRVSNSDTNKALIHSDIASGSHTCIVYMSEHDKPHGTAFFKHRNTGLINSPPISELNSQWDSDMKTTSEDVWEEVSRVEGRKNRAVIFPSTRFHSRFPFEGDELGSDRLIWACHFYRMDYDGNLY